MTEDDIYTPEYAMELNEARVPSEDDLIHIWPRENPDRKYVFSKGDEEDIDFEFVELHTDDGIEVDEEADPDVGVSKHLIREGFCDKVNDGYTTVAELKVGRDYRDDDE